MRGAVFTACLSGVLVAGCGGFGDPVPKTETPVVTAPTVLHAEATPTEPSGVAVPSTPIEATGSPSSPGEKPRRMQDCPSLSADRRPIEVDTLRVKGIILGGRSNVAMLSDSKGRIHNVRVGEFLGSKCWKVASIGTEWVSVHRESTIDGPPTDSQNIRLYVNDPPRHELAGR